MGGDSLLARYAWLTAEAKRHKAAIRHHREQLGATKAALDQVESECRRLGLEVFEVAPPATQTKAS